MTTTTTTTTTDLNVAERVAIATVIKGADKLKKTLAPGQYQVDETVRIVGTITKGQDYETVIAQRAAPWKLLAVALSKLNGVTVDSIVREAENIADETEKAIKANVEAALADIKGTVVGLASGKTTTNLAVEKVS